MAIGTLPIVPELETATFPKRNFGYTSVPNSGSLGMFDILGMFVGVCLIFTLSYMLGRGRIFWEDELLGWMLLRDPSWAHMVHAWKLGADGGGFGFYLTGRAWFALFGPSEISFRFYAATGFSLAFCTTWVFTRRLFSPAVTAFAVFNTWFFSFWLVTRMAEGRFYGLLTLGVALAVWLVFRAREQEGTPLTLCALAFLAHAVLTTSHLLGFLYSANLLFGLWFLDHFEGRRRPLLYLSGAAAWLLLIPERSAIAASAAVGKPHFWTVAPTVGRFLAAYGGFSVVIMLVEGLLALLAVYSLRKDPLGWRARLKQHYDEHRPAYVLTGILFCIPLEMLLEGLVGPSLFINRYLIPLALAQVLFTAELVTLIRWRQLPGFSLWRKKSIRVLAIAALAFALLCWNLGHVAHSAVSPTDFTTELSARMPHNLPVICEDALDFTELIGRQHTSGVPYTYILDWSFATSPRAPRAEVTQYHLMENWKKAGYFSGSIHQLDDFLQEHSKFVVLQGGFSLYKATTPETSSNPLAERFAHDPAYEVVPYGKPEKDGVQRTWLVCRGSCRTPSHIDAAQFQPEKSTSGEYIADERDYLAANEHTR